MLLSIIPPTAISIRSAGLIADQLGRDVCFKVAESASFGARPAPSTCHVCSPDCQAAVYVSCAGLEHVSVWKRTNSYVEGSFLPLEDALAINM